MWRAGVVVLAGCGRLLGIHDLALRDDGGASDAADGDTDAAVIDTAPDSSGLTECFGDNFDDGTLDPLKWQLKYATSPHTVIEAGGELAIALGANANAYQVVESVDRFDLTSGAYYVDVTQAVSQAGNANAGISVSLDASNDFQMNWGSNTLSLRITSNGIDYYAPSPPAYDPASRYWRISYSAGVVTMETSDGTGWVVRHSHSVAVAPTSAMLTMFAGEYAGGLASPGTAKFDNARILKPSCP